MGTNGADNNKKDPPTTNAEKEALEAEVSRFKYDCAQFSERKKNYLTKRKAYEVRKNAHLARNINAEIEQLHNNFDLQMTAKIEKYEARGRSLQTHLEKLQTKANEQLKNLPRSPYEMRKLNSEGEQQDKKTRALIDSISKEGKELENEIKTLPQRKLRAADNLIAQFNAEKKSLDAEYTQLESMREEVETEEEQLDEREEIIQKKIAQYRAKKEPSLELDTTHASSARQNESLPNPPLTFTHQPGFSQQSAIVSQSGMTLHNLVDFLRNPENLVKLNEGSKRTFVQVEQSLREVKNNEIKLDLVGQSGERTTIYAKAGKRLSGMDKIDFFVNKEANNDIETLRSACRLAVLSATTKNESAEFKINQKHPHASDIQIYLTEAILEIAKTKPELASQFKVDNDFPYSSQQASRVKASR